MNKKLFLFPALALLLISCEKDSPTDITTTPTNNTNTTAKTTYNGHIKPIIDNNYALFAMEPLEHPQD